MNHLNKTRMLSLLLVMIMAAGTVSCGETETVSNDTTTGGADTTTAASVTEEVAREDTPDSLPDGLDFGGREIRFAYNMGTSHGTTNEILGGEEETGDLVNDAVYARNRKVEERLNVKIVGIRGKDSYDQHKAEVRTVLMAGEDAYDVVAAVQYCITPMAIEGLFYDLADAKYLDYAQPWWNEEYMNTISIHEDVRYLLSGDISIMHLRNLSSIFVNTGLFEDNFGSVDDFYDLIMDGGWTYDVMGKYCADVFQDINNDGKADPDDVIGAGLITTIAAEHLAFTSGMKLSERDEDGYPTLITDQSRNVDITEAMYKFYYETEGVYVFPQPGSIYKEIVTKFTDGTMLFSVNRLCETDKLRDMKDSYGVIPFPKLDESQEKYLSLVHDGATLFGIPMTATDIDPICAVLEAMCAENYRTVTPAYYEVALKVKYTRDEVSAQFIDMIHDNAVTDFIYANNYALGTSVNLGTISRTLMGFNATPSSNYMSLYDSWKTQVSTAIEKLVEDVQKQ